MQGRQRVLQSVFTLRKEYSFFTALQLMNYWIKGLDREFKSYFFFKNFICQYYKLEAVVFAVPGGGASASDFNSFRDYLNFIDGL